MIKNKTLITIIITNQETHHCLAPDPLSKFVDFNIDIHLKQLPATYIPVA